MDDMTLEKDFSMRWIAFFGVAMALTSVTTVALRGLADQAALERVEATLGAHRAA